MISLIWNRNHLNSGKYKTQESIPKQSIEHHNLQIEAIHRIVVLFILKNRIKLKDQN